MISEIVFGMREQLPVFRKIYQKTRIVPRHWEQQGQNILCDNFQNLHMSGMVLLGRYLRIFKVLQLENEKMHW